MTFLVKTRKMQLPETHSFTSLSLLSPNTRKHTLKISKEKKSKEHTRSGKRFWKTKSPKKLKEELVEPEAVVDTAEESSAVIDSLLEKLKSSTPITTNRAKTKNRRSKALSFYSENPLEIVADTKYESVNNLKRRMTTRKRTTDGETSPKSEQFMLRAQAMLHQLRNKEE